MPTESHAPVADAEAVSAVATTDVAQARRLVQVSSAERWLLRTFLRAMGNPAIRIVLWNGESVCAAEAKPVATMQVKNRRALLRLMYDPDLGFGEAYTDGRIRVDGDLVSLLEAAYRVPVNPWADRLLRRTHRPHANTLRGSRHNIHRHYDLGNDFYRLWLDERLVYTCAYFPTPSAALDEAQAAKMELVCRKVGLRPGERVVEAGCGWGGHCTWRAGTVSRFAPSISHTSKSPTRASRPASKA